MNSHIVWNDRFEYKTHWTVWNISVIFDDTTVETIFIPNNKPLTFKWIKSYDYLKINAWKTECQDG